MENEKVSEEITPTNPEEDFKAEDVDGKQKLLGIAAHVGWLVAGIGYVLLPLAIYLFADKRFPFVARHAKQALKVQALLVPVVLIVMVCATFAGILMVFYGFLVFFCLLPFSLYASYKVANGEEYNYPLLEGNFNRKKGMIAGGILLFMLTTAFISSAGDKKEDVNKTASMSSSTSKSSSSNSSNSSSPSNPSSSSNNSKTPVESKSEPESESPPKLANTVNYEEVSAQDMMAALEANPARARSILLNRNIKITGGSLGFIDSDGKSFTLDSGIVTNIRCKIKTKEAEDALLDFVKGQRITVYGKVNRVGESLGYTIHVTKLE